MSGVLVGEPLCISEGDGERCEGKMSGIFWALSEHDRWPKRKGTRPWWHQEPYISDMPCRTGSYIMGWMDHRA